MTNWGIIGAGGIARVFTHGVRFSRTGRVVAIASRTPARGKSLAEDFSIPRLYGSYEELLADKEVDAVYVSLIHPHHAEWAIKAARAGKHVLVEKPLAMNSLQAARMIDAAQQSGVFLMEAFMYRCHPQMARMAELMHDKPEVSEIVVTADRDLYAYETDTVDQYKEDRKAPAMSWQDSMGNMQLLDRWREEIGLSYKQDSESEETS